MQQLKQHPFITNEFDIRKLKKVLWRMLDIVLAIHARRRLLRYRALCNGLDPSRELYTGRRRNRSPLPCPLDLILPTD